MTGKTVMSFRGEIHSKVQNGQCAVMVLNMFGDQINGGSCSLFELGWIKHLCGDVMFKL